MKKQKTKLSQLLFLGFFISSALTNAQVNLGPGSGTAGMNGTFIGENAGSMNSGDDNTFIGTNAGAFNTTGTSNVYLGVRAGENNNGKGNVFLGFSAGQNEQGDNQLFIGNSNTSAPLVYGDFAASKLIFNGRVGIQTEPSSAILQVGGTLNPNFKITNLKESSLEIAVAGNPGDYSIYAEPGDAVFRTLGGGEKSKMIFSMAGNKNSKEIIFSTDSWDGGKIMTIKEFGMSGKVAIGTSNFPSSIGGADISGYKLFVQGGILSDEVRVRTGWADYVFADNYKLKPLSEVENFIKENKHLPNVPSAQEVEKQGLNIGDMVRIQQEKIEELTLYIIQLQKEIKELKDIQTKNK